MTGRPFRIARIGSRAARILQRNNPARVAAVFDTSFYIETSAGDFVCIGAQIGNGPLNAVVEDGPPDGWASAGIATGQAIAPVASGLLAAPGVSFEATGALVWAAPPWPTAAPMHGRKTALAQFISDARHRAPGEGFAGIVLDAPPTGGIARAGHRIAGLAIATLQDWLVARCTGRDDTEASPLEDAASRATRALVGAGPGLTPSGDDLIAGMLIALHALSAGEAASSLAAFIRAAPADATSPLSCAFLYAAIDGEPTQALHTLIAALLAADLDALPAAVDAIDAVGHCSGWDMAAGALLALQSLSDA